MTTFNERRRLRALKRTVRGDASMRVAMHLEKLEADFAADLTDLAIDVTGKLTIDLGEAATVSKIKDDTGTLGLLVQQSSGSESFVVLFSKTIDAAENGDNVEVSFTA
jgi:hypothetical protein